MKITVKTTQGKVFQVDVEATDTVAALKQKIFDTQGHSVAVQKIIYSGKILPDDKTVESCGIKEKDFLVLMVSKPKPTPTPMPSTSAPASVPVASPPPAVPAAPTPAAEAAPSIPAESSPAATTDSGSAQPPAEPAFGDTSSFLSGPALQTTINNMTEMGFPREQVLRALRASFNNPDRAVEYLMNGIPAHLEAEAAASAGGASRAAPAASGASAGTTAPEVAGAAAPAAPAPAAAAPPSSQPQNLFQLAQQQQQQAQQGGGVGTGTGAAGAPQLDLEGLRNHPQIAQLRDLVRQNPALVQPILQQMATQNPGLAQTLAANPNALMQLLGGDEGDLEGEGDIPPGAQVLAVTPEERAAIERLEALGFPRHLVIEAYFACDKNEELAANYLFEAGFDDAD
ncbi:hypothetical protein HGRIS_002433 [Hohenbuehelia grisea]|uniref:UV excision repair protein RAD23 n=1 Tax=Hohenbuehelia grisea TaxID=104357 RepID=A0ABR3JMC7_9AGAR